MLYYTLASLILLIAHWSEASRDDHEDIVAALANFSILTNKRVENAMMQVIRENYIEQRMRAYEYREVGLDYGATISAPDMQVILIQAIEDKLQEGSRVLDVGSGSGYSTVFMALMVGEKGYVVGIDHIPELVKMAKKNVKKDNPLLLEKQRVIFVEGDGRLGYPSEGPYDVIHVGALVVGGDVPEALVQQLKEGGRLVMLVDLTGGVGVQYNEVMTIDKLSNGSLIRNVLQGEFLPMNTEPLSDKEIQLLPESTRL